MSNFTRPLTDVYPIADGLARQFPHVKFEDVFDIIDEAIRQGDLLSHNGAEIEKRVERAYEDGTTDGRDEGVDERDNDWETALSYALEGVDSYLDDITDIVVSCEAIEEYEEVKAITLKIHNLIEGMQP